MYVATGDPALIDPQETLALEMHAGLQATISQEKRIKSSALQPDVCRSPPT
jgi:hypothetical protein